MGLVKVSKELRAARNERSTETALPFLGPLGRPLGAVVDVLSRPMYAIGNLSEGEGREALRALNPFEWDIRRRGLGDVGAEAIFGKPSAFDSRGKSIARGLFRFGGNVLSDPLLFTKPFTLTKQGLATAKTAKLGATLAEQGARGERALVGFGLPFKPPAAVIRGQPVLSAMSKVGAPIKAAATAAAEKFSPELRIFKRVGPSGRTAKEVIEEVEPAVRKEAREFLARVSASAAKLGVVEKPAEEAGKVFHVLEVPQAATGKAGVRLLWKPKGQLADDIANLERELGGDKEAVKALQRVLTLRDQVARQMREAATAEARQAALSLTEQIKQGTRALRERLKPLATPASEASQTAVATKLAGKAGLFEDFTANVAKIARWERDLAKAGPEAARTLADDLLAAREIVARQATEIRVALKPAGKTTTANVALRMKGAPQESDASRDILRAVVEIEKRVRQPAKFADAERVSFLETSGTILNDAKKLLLRDVRVAAGPGRGSRIRAILGRLRPYHKAMETYAKIKGEKLVGRGELASFWAFMSKNMAWGKKPVPFDEIAKQVGRGRVELTPAGHQAAREMGGILSDLTERMEALGVVDSQASALNRAIKADFVHNYVPHQIVNVARIPKGGATGLAQGLKGEKARVLAGPLSQVEKTIAEEAAKKGETAIAPFTRDPFQATGIKATKFFDTKMKAEQVRALLTEFGEPVLAGMDIPAGFRMLRITPENRGVLETIGGRSFALPNDIAAHIEKNYWIIIDPLGLEGGGRQRFQWWRGFMSWWRQTSLAFPATRVRDAISNEIQLLQMGVKPNPTLMKEATVAAWNLNNPQLLAGRSWGGKTLKEWTDLAKDHAVFDQYEGAFDLSRQFAAGAFDMEPNAWAKFLAEMRSTPLTKTINPLSQQGWNVQASRAAATVLDNQARLTAFMDLVAGGANPLNARKMIDKVFPTARNLTSFERESIAPLTSFYTWQRTNLPHQLRQLIQNPAQFSAIVKLDRAIQDEQRKKLPWELLPTGVRESVPIAMGRTDDGLHKFISLTNYFPQTDVTKWVADQPTIREMVLATPWHVFRRALLEAAPPIRAGIELGVPHNIYRKLSYEELPDRVRFMGVFMPRQLADFLGNVRLLSTTDRFGKTLFPRKATHPEPGREPETFAEFTARELLGMPKIKTVNPAEARKEYKRKIDREVSERRGGIRRQGRYEGTEAEQDRLRAEIKKLFSRKRQVLEGSR